MTRNSKLSTLFSRSQQACLRTNRRKAESRRLMLENLEGRCVLSSISGIVFNDANGNGSQDGGELPLAGITVFHETDANALLDVGEDTVVTGGDGSYQFSFPTVPAGVWHYGSAIFPAGDSTGRWLNTNNYYQQVAVPPGATVDAVVNFGFRFVPYAGGFYPVGGETLVNQTVAGEQGTAANTEHDEFIDANSVAADNAGNYVVAWLSPQADLQDKVFVRVFNADGTPRTNDILVGTATRTSASWIPQMPVVAMSGDGSRFAVSWDGYGGATTPKVRTYNGVTGNPVTGVVQVSANNKKESLHASGIAMDASGDFAVLMTGIATASGPGGVSYATLFQRFNSSGAAVGSRTIVSAAILGNGSEAIAMDGAGNFVVSFQGYFSATNNGIFAQRYSASGAKVGNLMTVAAGGNGTSVAMNSSGRFVVTWTGAGGGTAQVYNAAGQPLGGNVVFGEAGNLHPGTSRGTAIDSAGNVTVAWKAKPYNVESPPDLLLNTTDIRVRRLNADGSLSDTFIVNSTIEGRQIQPSVAATGDGFIVSWNGRGAGDDAGVFTQRYTTTPPPAAPAGASSLDAALVDFLMSEDTSKKR